MIREMGKVKEREVLGPKTEKQRETQGSWD